MKNPHQQFTAIIMRVLFTSFKTLKPKEAAAPGSLLPGKLSPAAP